MISIVVTPSAISASRRGSDCRTSSSSLAARNALTDETMPPPALRDLFIGGAGQPHLELIGAVAGMDEMGVAVDQAGRDPAAFAIDDLGACRRGSGEFVFRTGIGDPAVARGERAALDDAEAGCSRGQRRKPGIAPDARLRLRCFSSQRP